MSRKNRARKRSALPEGRPASVKTPPAPPSRDTQSSGDRHPGAPKRFDLEAELARPERALHPWLSGLFSTVWYVVGLLLIVMTLGYCIIQLVMGTGPTLAIGIFVFLCMVAVLFLGEGSEIAVAMLIDKDPEQFELFLQPWFATLWRSKDRKPPRFIIGRQLIVVFAVVAITFLGGRLSEIPNPWDPAFLQAIGPVRSDAFVVKLDTWLSEGWVQFMYDLLFPTFLALWIAQLPSKFIADQDPLRTYSWSPTRWLIHGALMAGAYLQIEHFSARLSSWLVNWAGTPPEPLAPGRRSYHETSARLRGGRAVTKVEITITIGAAGQVAVREAFAFHAFSKCLQKLPQHAYWESSYTKCLPVRFTKFPQHIGREPKVLPQPSSQPELKHGKQMYAVEWDIEFQGPLPPDEDVAFELEYETNPGAVKCAPHTEDCYYYDVRQVPTQELVVTVIPAPDAPFILNERPPVAEASEEQEVNVDEATRITIDPLDNGGLCFRVMYPLLGTRFTFNWAVAPG